MAGRGSGLSELRLSKGYNMEGAFIRVSCVWGHRATERLAPESTGTEAKRPPVNYESLWT